MKLSWIVYNFQQGVMENENYMKTTRKDIPLIW